MISARHIRVSAWSPTQKRCSPVSRAMLLMMGGRSLAEVPWPCRFWARRRGGALGSRWGVLVFPRVLVAFVGRKGRASHDLGWGGVVQVPLHALASRLQWLA